MKSYLSLIPVSAKVHNRQSRMTRLCIIIAVFLVTAIFSIVDMNVSLETKRMIEGQGNWHIALQNISEVDAKQIKERSDIAVASWYEVLNGDVQKEYYIDGKRTVLCGADETYITKIWNGVKEGSYPQNESEVMLNSGAKQTLGIQVNDKITVNTPGGNINYTVSGFGDADAGFNDLYDANTVFMSRAAFEGVCRLNRNETPLPVYYIQFKDSGSINKGMNDIKQQYGWTDETIIENKGVLGMMGVSSNPTIQALYPPAIVLFILILCAGVLMISGSINSNVSQRTKFFGMMRCIGASRQQIIRFVRLEALNWCKTAVPLGVGFGIVVSWGICALLRFGIGGEFADTPIFRLSTIGIISGVIVGIVTVLLAAQAPAKYAAKVSPIAAVSDHAGNMQNIRHTVNVRFSKIEIALGINHAVSARKNLFLMTGSFALSIILFLGFFAGLDFAKSLLPSMRSWQPDFSIVSNDNSNSVDKSLVSKIEKEPNVKHVFGTMYATDVLVSTDKDVDKVNLVSYGDYMLGCAKNSMVSGDSAKVYGNSDSVLTIYHSGNPLKVGDKVQFNGTELDIAGAVSDGLMADGITLICSEETFIRLMGENDYGTVSVQLSDEATDKDINTLRSFAGEGYSFSDTRQSNQESNATFWAFRLFAYSFLAIIAMITIMNIVNSTSMSVSAKIRQYGSMRAVGMDSKQLTVMIASEVFTYAFSGCVVGCALGIPLHWALFHRLVTNYFGNPWSAPVIPLGIILLTVIITAAIAVYIPAKRIHKMAVTDTINEL